MKSIIPNKWLARSGVVLAGTVLTLTAFSTAATMVQASSQNSQNDRIAEKILDLQQSDQRWIQINLSTQRLIAWEGANPVYAIIISSGKSKTPTRVGTFAVQTKLKTTRMRGRDYDVPNVPYTMFYSGNYAIHGAYWHNRFGTPVSSGCVNLAVNHAKWLFKWASVGTPIIIHQ
ncbi:MAG: L,D-transpeptidase [Nostocaceae cyanobacterium]|nr:L,D-transpeptidase [Nostocaceae cyanobacterium]